MIQLTYSSLVAANWHDIGLRHLLERLSLKAISIRSSGYESRSITFSLLQSSYPVRNHADSDRMCQRSAWICKEQALWLVSRGVLLYILN